MIKVPSETMSGESLLFGSKIVSCLLTVSHRVEGAGELSKATLRTQSPLKGHLSKYHHLGGQFSTYEFWGHRHSAWSTECAGEESRKPEGGQRVAALPACPQA
mgnify:CR=1 FL=1